MRASQAVESRTALVPAEDVFQAEFNTHNECSNFAVHRLENTAQLRQRELQYPHLFDW